MRSTIKVLIVDDSALIRQMLVRALSLDPKLEIVGTARNGIEAIEKAAELSPDIITLDVEMPELTGIEALPHLIKTTPARIVMLSSVDDPDTTYQALARGAVDFLVKPKAGVATSLSELAETLIKKIKIAYRVSPERRFALSGTAATEAGEYCSGLGAGAAPVATDISRVVAIASSTGGPPALEAVFSGLTASLPAAYVVVQHLPAGFTESLARRLSRVTDIRVEEGRSGAQLKPGVAYLAPHGTHMKVVGATLPRLRLEDSPSMHGVRPAADPLLLSVGEVFGARSVGVVLTGMGSDGAVGLKRIFDNGGETIVQDEQSSTVWGMPKAAINAGAADRIVPLQQVAIEIRRALREGGVS
ncbi:MAG: chemotaxis response regulator protein-glutamate methylesterase [Coriobacteriia bacterium]|nr:chemotaxis response regulator protein-glutamate methylesterase [Coriobacteriia bacterium]MBN2822014.1 chemotaxis response regulator protein-glutamate methylesterase [Coriobacteriia bacterium]